MTRIFISHSHSDEAIAYKLVDFLLAALELKEKEILCTSNPDQGLSYSSSSITDQLKNQLKNSEALIILITADSLHSAWIPFEAGSFWTTNKPIIPILGPGLTQNDLLGPLKSFLSIPIEVRDVEDRLNNAIKQIAISLNLQQEVTRRRNYKLQEFSSALKAWQSKRPKTDPATQEEIAELKAQIEKFKTVSQKEKEELEQQLQEEKTRIQQLEVSETKQKQQLRELEESLQSKINQLEKQLAQAESQNETDQKEIISLREKLKEQSQKALEDKKQEPSQAQTFIEDLGNDIKLEMIAIPSGKFLMGTADEDIERLVKEHDQKSFRREKPQHEVTVPAFYMGIYPVTQAQYQKIVGKNPSRFKGDDRPVEQVSWEDAVEFCKKLSQQTETEYRLPTEAEWEYACRAGTNTAYYFGDNLTKDLANYSGNIGKTTVVGKYTSNSFGLYDMHGNVWEWCQDDWHDTYENAPKDGIVWSSESSTTKVLRGGSWDYNPSFCRSAYRFVYFRGHRLDFIGFRVVCVVPRAT